MSLIKLDIETGEPDALHGASRTLARDHPTILSEVLSNDVGAELKSLLAPLDYRFYHLTPEGPVEHDEIVGHPEWLKLPAHRDASGRTSGSESQDEGSALKRRYRMVCR